MDVDYSSTQTDSVRSNSQTFGEVLIPSLVNITLFNANKVGQGWTGARSGARACGRARPCALANRGCAATALSANYTAAGETSSLQAS